MNNTKKGSFDFGLKAFKARNFGRGICVRLDPAQVEIISRLVKVYPKLYDNNSDVIRCAINFFLKHEKERGVLNYETTERTR